MLKKSTVLNGYRKLYCFLLGKRKHVTIASLNSCCGDAPVACVDLSAFVVLLFPIGKQQHSKTACLNSCCGDGHVACVYLDVLEMLLWCVFCGYANHQAWRFCMFNFVFVRLFN